MRLENQTALITGASRGIGKAIATTFARHGANVVVNYVSSAVGASEVVNEIERMGRRAIAIKADVSRRNEVDEMVKRTIEEYGRIDILVNNAGTGPASTTVLNSDERLWETIMNLNLKGLYFTSQAVARIMKKQDDGRIVNIASVDGIKPEPGVSIYDVSKAGVRMITSAFALELAPFNIRVNTIAPGPISTKLLNSHWFHLPPEEAKKQKEALAKMTPNNVTAAVIAPWKYPMAMNKKRGTNHRNQRICP
jgi:3-oxoacyl-[acyl-carrier protein] reductase